MSTHENGAMVPKVLMIAHEPHSREVMSMSKVPLVLMSLMTLLQNTSEYTQENYWVVISAYGIMLSCTRELMDHHG